MHELSICRGMLTQVAALAAERGASGVRSITLRIGPLSGVEPQLLQSAFPAARAGTIAEDAALRIEIAPLRVRCEQCGAESDARPDRLLCGRCGDRRTRLLSGDELVLKSVELMT